MFRESPGFKAQYHYVTMIVSLDFDQWKILLQGPGVVIDGGRQSDTTTAKQEASRIAERYIREEKHEALPTLRKVEWTAIDPHSCLSWQPARAATADG